MKERNEVCPVLKSLYGHSYAYYQANKERINAWQKEYTKANKERLDKLKKINYEYKKKQNVLAEKDLMKKNNKNKEITSITKSHHFVKKFGHITNDKLLYFLSNFNNVQLSVKEVLGISYADYLYFCKCLHRTTKRRVLIEILKDKIG